MSLLDVRNLSLSLETSRGTVQAVRKINFSVNAGEIVAVVGESGCGKTMTCMSILNLFLKNNANYSKETSIRFEGQEITGLSEKKMRMIRGNKIGVVFQDPMKSLNPTEKIGDQIVDILKAHKKLSKNEAKKEAEKLLEKVGITDVHLRCNQYPHELSGGMRQRVVLAMAIACEPLLLIADEPTTALDVTIQAQVLEVLKNLQKERNMALLLVSHNLGIVASIADRIIVMYGGKILEEGTVDDIFEHPQHPYTKALLNTIPKEEVRRRPLEMIEGTPPNLLAPPKGCPFLARCRMRMQICGEEFPEGYARNADVLQESVRDKCFCWLQSPEYKAWKQREKENEE